MKLNTFYNVMQFLLFYAFNKGLCRSAKSTLMKDVFLSGSKDIIFDNQIGRSIISLLCLLWIKIEGAKPNYVFCSYRFANWMKNRNLSDNKQETDVTRTVKCAQNNLFQYCHSMKICFTA